MWGLIPLCLDTTLSGPIVISLHLLSRELRKEKALSQHLPSAFCEGLESRCLELL